MISESQERMLCVVEPDRVPRCWRSATSGRSTRPRSARSPTPGGCGCSTASDLVGDLPVGALVDECPAYDLEPAPPAVPIYPAPPRDARRRARPRGDAARRCSASANLASRRWAFEQYDCIVGSRTVRRPGGGRRRGADARGRRARIAVSIDGNGRRVAVDPYRGAVEAVLECSANLACAGAEPLGLTNCLNFGNPEKPHIAWQLTRAVAGLGDACRALGVPVVGGNVSLYNEGGERPDLPDAGRRHGRRAARPGALAAGSASRRTGDAVALIAAALGPGRRRLRAGQAARRGARRRAPARRPRRAARAARRRPPGRALRRAALGARRRRGRPRGRAGRVLPRAAAAARGSTSAPRPTRRCCSARAPARSSSPARARRSRASAPPRACSARSAATRCAIEGVLDVPVERARPRARRRARRPDALGRPASPPSGQHSATEHQHPGEGPPRQSNRLAQRAMILGRHLARRRRGRAPPSPRACGRSA